MTLIEGIGDEVTHFFIGLFVVIVVSLAWWTTNISEHRHVQTVWLLDRRRHRAHRRLTNHTHSVTIAEGTTTTAGDSEEAVPTAVETTENMPKPPEAGTSSSENSAGEDRAEAEVVEDVEQSRILEAMDADTYVVRQRRLDFYNRASENGSNEHIDESITVISPESIDTISPDSTIMEHNYADQEETTGSLDNPTSNQATSNREQTRDTSDIRIKLKYINDDLKLVDGKLQEQLGDFKKRHFQGEITSNKLVRLIFNGQVLHQDNTTLEGCGFFDNCVVHCLIHQRRPAPGEDSSESVIDNSSSHFNRGLPQNSPNQARDWDLGNFLFAIVSFILLSAWYFRYVYAHLYTVTATVGLILMTGVFTIVLFGAYFPDHEHIPQRVETTAQS